MKQRQKETVVVYLVGGITLVLAIFPIVWIVLTSFKTNPDAFSSVPLWIFKPFFDHWKIILFERQFARLLVNSFIICSISVLVSLFMGSLAAYGFAQSKIRGENQILFWMLSLRFLPQVAVIIPLFILLRGLKLLDTYQGMIIVYTMINLPLVVWLMRAYFLDIPEEIGEAADIDGCSKFGKFWRIYLPLASNGIIATSILIFVLSWNEFIFASIFTRVKATTLPVGAINIMTDRGIYWGEISSGVTFIITPMVVLFLLIGRHLARGLTLGALK